MFQKVIKLRAVLFVAFLSILLIPAVSALIIEEIDSGKTTTITATGTNIDVATINDHIDQRTQEILNSIELSIDEKLAVYEAKLDSIVQKLFLKIGLGIISICLFIFNFSIASKIIIEGVENS